MKDKIFFLAVVAAAISSCGKKDAAPVAPAKGVNTVTVEERNVVGYQSFPTSIQGRVNNDVRAKIQGYITQVLVDEGQSVTKGQPLFRIETNMLNESAQAAKSGIGAAQANVVAAQARVQAAQVEVSKLKPLVDKKIISNVQLQTAEANLASANAQLQQAKAGVSQAQANYKGVQANIDYSIIRAPISGVVGKINLRTGSLVGPNDQQPITTVSDTAELYAYFSMNEKEYLDFLKNSTGATVPEKLRNMPMVELVLANGDVYSEKGKIQAVTGQIDPLTGSIQFRVSLPNPQKLLSNGNSGTIRIPKSYDQALVVPETSTYEQQGLVYVYKVEKDTARNVVVKVEDRVNNMVVITDGVKKGEIVVAEGVGTLKPGTAVKGTPVKFDDIIEAIKPVF